MTDANWKTTEAAADFARRMPICISKREEIRRATWRTE